MRSILSPSEIGRAALPLCALSAMLLMTTAARAQTVLSRARLGNNVEDITFVTKGPLANHVVTVDGYEVFGLPGRGAGNSRARKLFDLRGLDIQTAPRGMTFVESEKLFAFQVPAEGSLFFLDHQGQLKAVRPIQFLGGFEPNHIEGLAYLPHDSPAFPDHILAVAWDENLDCDDGQGSRIEVMTRQGEVVAEIFPEDPLRCEEVVGVAFVEPNRLVATSFPSNTIWTLDLGGQLLAPPLSVSGTETLDGVVQLDDGRVVAGDYESGRLLYFDPQLNRLPGDDRANTVGVGLSGLTGVAWDSDANRHLVMESLQLTSRVVAAVPPTLDSAATLVDLAATPFSLHDRLSYMPDEDRVVISHRNSPRAILLFDGVSGAFAELINLPPPPPGNIRGVEYLPPTQQFAARLGQNPQLVRILSRTGTIVGLIDFSAAGLTAVGGIAYFDPSHPSGGQFLVFEADIAASGHRAVITDFAGNLLGEFDYREKLGVLAATDLAFISTGPQSGAFSLVDFDSSELVVFTLD
jgi:hypothetical protein